MDIGKSVSVSLRSPLRSQMHNRLAESLQGSTMVSVIELGYRSTNEPLSERFGWQIGKVIKSTTDEIGLFTL